MIKRRIHSCLVLSVCALTSVARADNLCDAPGDIPDLLVGDLFQVLRNGSAVGITAYSVGTTACNAGTCWLDWCDTAAGGCASTNNNRRHPVIQSAMYRLKAGRMEQLGQSWLVHLYAALSLAECFGDCQGVPDMNHLGVHCSDPFNAGTSGQQVNLGPKDEVNASTGEFLNPFRTQGQSSSSPIYKRLQVSNDDLEPDLNPGAQYYLESMYVQPDDAPVPDTDDDLTPGNGIDDFDQEDNSANNSSYRRVTISEPSPGTYDLAFAASVVRERAALFAWKAADPMVLIDEITVPGDGRYWVASKATDLGGGQWHYEYAVMNHTSDRSARAFSVPLPLGININPSNIGFHDVNYHSENTDGSGSFYDPTDWPHNGGADLELEWSTLTFAENPRANALRWNTLYNFRFDADMPPTPTFAQATIALFEPGSPQTVTAKVIGPLLCDGDGICDTGESAGNCVADCFNQNGGGGQCGDGTCNSGESSCSCTRDCGPPQETEFACDDGEDNDCDGLADCSDSDCCADAPCSGADADGDGFELCDCNDADPDVWAVPGEVEEVFLSHDIALGTTLDWLPPDEPGATVLTYEVIRSQNPANLVTSTTCVPDGNPSDTTLVDPASPGLGSTFFYDVRAVNTCPQGEGPLGRNSDNIPREGRSCP